MTYQISFDRRIDAERCCPKFGKILKALLFALLEPTDWLMALENEGDYTSRLAILEELKTMPFEAVWDHYCLEHKVPVGIDWLDELKEYEKEVQRKRR